MKIWINSHGYAMTKIGDKNVRVHRLVWEEANGPIPSGMDIDHINGDRTDNRIENLRPVTRAENMKNCKVYKNSKTGVPGVCWCKVKKKWRVYLVENYKQKHLGYYRDWFDAVCARMSANNKYNFHVNHGRR